MKSTAARKLKQVPQGYLVMGVDPHGKKHAAVAITQDFTIYAYLCLFMLGLSSITPKKVLRWHAFL